MNAVWEAHARGAMLEVAFGSNGQLVGVKADSVLLMPGVLRVERAQVERHEAHAGLALSNDDAAAFGRRSHVPMAGRRWHAQ